MRDFTDSLESLGDIQDKYPPSTLVLRAQFLYMLQDQFRDLERDYRKISEMYVAEMEKAAKLEQRMRHDMRKRCLVNAEKCFESRERWRYRYGDWSDKGYDRSYKWRKVEFWGSWGRHWLDLAEKFKERE